MIKDDIESATEAANQDLLNGDDWRSLQYRLMQTENINYTPTGQALQMCHDRLLEACQANTRPSEWISALAHHPHQENAFLTATHQGISLPGLLIQHGNIANLEFFLNKCSKTNLPPGLLIVAAEQAPVKSIPTVLEILVKYGADRHDIDRKGNNALSAWVEREDITAQTRQKFLSIFLDRKTAITQDKNGVCAWQKAIRFNQPDTLATLLTIISNEVLNTPDIRGWTACHWLASSNARKCIRVLQDHQMKMLDTTSGIKPIELAQNAGWETFADDLSRKPRSERPVVKQQPKSEQLGLF